LHGREEERRAATAIDGGDERQRGAGRRHPARGYRPVARDRRGGRHGEKPAASSAQHTTATATVVAIDKKNSTADLRGPRGRTVKVEVADPAKLENVKVGDLVEIVYTEAVAIEVTAPAKATSGASKKK
jgi:hypothetical protein